MKEAYVSIGSNIDASKNIQAVKSYLSIFDDIRYSSIYTTPAEGFEGEDFLNCVCNFRTAKSPYDLRNLLKRVERDMGRTTSQKGMSSRVIDLDLILYGDFSQRRH